MKKALLAKMKEAFLSVLPVVAIVMASVATPFADLSGKELTVFLISSVFLILGIGLFNLGADIAMTPMGKYMGTGLTKGGNLKLLLLVSFLMGVLITVAEPDLSVLASQTGAVMNGTLLHLKDNFCRLGEHFIILARNAVVIFRGSGGRGR